MNKNVEYCTLLMSTTAYIGKMVRNHSPAVHRGCAALFLESSRTQVLVPEMAVNRGNIRPTPHLRA